MILRKATRSGGSVSITIPALYARLAGITPGDYVTVTLAANEHLIIAPLHTQTRNHAHDQETQPTS